MNSRNFYDQILPLVEVTRSTLKSKQETGLLQIDISSFVRWEVTSLDYSDSGLHLALRADQIAKIFPLPAAIKIAEIVHETSEYRNLIEFVKNNTHICENPINLVNYFLIDIIEKYIENQATFDSKRIEFIDALIADLKNTPNKTRAIVEFYGIILQEDEIRLSPEIIIRKPMKEDFNIDLLWNPFFFNTDFPEPSAILDITLQARDRGDLINEIKKTIMALQLFRPTMIKWHIYRINSVSYNPCFERKDPPIERHLTFENYIMKKDEAETFKKFWKTVFPILPQDFSSFEVNNSHLSKAIKFYSDSLSQIEMTERKIASSIIGLESIFLKNIDENNKSKNLTSRITKVLGNQIISSVNVKEIIGDAYFCRTKFLHGDFLSEKETQQLGKKYGGDLNYLLVILLEYLRLSIVIFIIFNSEKKLFIEIVDGSSKDQNANQQLMEFLECVNPTIRVIEQKREI